MTLQNIKSVLEDWEFQAKLAPIAEGMPAQQLTVALEETHSLQAVIFFLSDLLKATQEDGAVSAALAEEETDFLQLFIRFPFELQESAYADLSRLILMINWSTPVGAFGLNEVQKILYYRQVFECLDSAPDAKLVADAVSGMQYYAALHFELLKTIATAEKSLYQIMTALESEGRRREVFPGYDL